MSRVNLGASLLVAIVCLSLSGKAIAQSDQGEPDASAPGGYGGEYGGRGGYGVTAVEADDPFGGVHAKAEREDIVATDQTKHTSDNRQNGPAADHIESALNKPLKSPLQYEDQPLNEIIDMLQEEYNIPVMFDNAALEEVAISPDTEITINLRNVTLRSALNLMLRQPGLEDLTFVIDEEVLLITTEEKANEKLTLEVYRVDDLVRGYRQLPSNDENPYGSLVQVITHSVEYDTWMANGKGEGEVLLMQPGILVVSTTRRVHEKVRQLLDKLRVARAEIEEDYSYGRGGGRGGRGNF